MDLTIPRVAAIHDLSCFGRCSLTVIMPVLAAMGIQVCPLPTAIFSTHLGGFSDPSFVDLTMNIPKVYNHWQREEITFDCIYSGFLASERQIEIVSQFIDKNHRSRPLIVVDPVMGDDGKLYSIYTPAMQQQMKFLIEQADIITPNYTEACILLNKEYQPTVSEISTIPDWLISLARYGPKKIVITGIPLQSGQLLNIGYDAMTEQVWQIITERVPVKYPGTGDIFASLLIGSLLRKCNLAEAITTATEFVGKAIKLTFAAKTPPREGVLLEKVMQQILL